MKSFEKFWQRLSNRRGQSLVEYGILIGGVALVSLAAVAILGHKTNDLCAVHHAATENCQKSSEQNWHSDDPPIPNS